MKTKLTEADKKRLTDRQDHLLVYCRTLTKSESEAKDLYQASFERALIGTFEEGTNVEGWFKRIAFNQYRSDFVRNIKKTVVSAPDVMEMHMEKANLFTQQDSLIILKDTLRHIASLPDHSQQVFDVMVFDGASYEQAAENLGIEVGTVKSRLSRARSALQASINSGKPPSPEPDPNRVAYLFAKATGAEQGSLEQYTNPKSPLTPRSINNFDAK